MSDKTRKKPAKEDTTFIDNITEDQAQELIEAAATISGKPAAEMTLDEAVQIMKDHGLKMPNLAAMNVAAVLWANVNPDQLKQILAAANPKETEEAILSVIEEITQEAQEDTETIIEKWEEAIVQAGGYETVQEELKETFLAAISPEVPDTIKHSAATEEFIEAAKTIATELKIQPVTQVSIFQDTMATIAHVAKETLDEITKLTKSKEYNTIKEKEPALALFLEQTRLRAESLKDAGEELHTLLPFLQMELDKNDMPGTTLKDVITDGYDDDLKPTEKYQQIIDQVRTIQSIIPQWYKMPNNPLINDLRERAKINAGPYDLIVANKKGRRQEITAYTVANINPDIIGTGKPVKLPGIDIEILNAISSLWIEAKSRQIPCIITPDMVHRAMPGGGEKASPQQRKLIKDTIEKLRRLFTQIDVTDEMRARKIIGENETMILDDAFLSAIHGQYKVKNGGQTTDAYLIKSEPIALTYSLLNNQILSMPARYIAVEKVKKGKATGELLSMTPARQVMTGYMLRRIAVMKNDDKEARRKKRNDDRRRAQDKTLEARDLDSFREQSLTILFDSIFEAAGISDQSRDRAMDNRNFCFQVLDYQVAVGNIKGYEKITEGRSIKGVKISFSTQKPKK